jgi:hypothetical protein
MPTKSSATMLSSSPQPPDNNNSLDFLADDDTPTDRQFLTDEDSPVDRRYLSKTFNEIMSRYKIDKTKFAECAEISTGTLSTINVNGATVAWKTWELVIAGLIKFHKNAALVFWQGLPAHTQQEVREHTKNQLTQKYILKMDEDALEDVNSLKSHFNLLLSKVDPKLIDDEFLRGIKLPGNQDFDIEEIMKSSGTDSNSQLFNSGNANFYSKGNVSIGALIVLPTGVDIESPQFSNLMNGLIKSGRPTSNLEDSENIDSNKDNKSTK